MKVKYIFMAGLILAILMVGAVSATDTISEDIISDAEDTPLEITDNEVYTTGESSFSNLTDEIENTGTSLNLTKDYTFNNETDDKNGIVIGKDSFVLNGNGCTIDGKNQSRIFNITANNITIKDLILMNGNAEMGGAIYSTGSFTLNNVTFINNYAKTSGGAIELYNGSALNCSNSRFIDNYADIGSSILVTAKSKLNLYNSNITSKIFNRYSQIAVFLCSMLYVENATFYNTSSSYASACYIDFSVASIVKSRFVNLKANVTAGAIGVKENCTIHVENCEFINTTSSKNGGAIYADVTGPERAGHVTITDTVFKDTSSEFGGAYLQLNGDLYMKNIKFINTHATYNGGSVYLAWVSNVFNNCTFDSSSVELFEDYPTYGGAIYSFYSSSNRIHDSKFFNNKASAGSAIYLYDATYKITNSVFENNTNPIYTVFDNDGTPLVDESNRFINDGNVSTNNTFYETIIVGQGQQLTLLNNSISVDIIPKKFDLRDWGWVSPVRNQGRMGACWTFGMTGALESALLKAAGITTDFSENNMQNTMLMYSIYGINNMDEGGTDTAAAGYLLSWLGAFSQDEDTFDELGKVSPLFTTEHNIHVQDVMFIPNNDIPNCTQLKLAIMKYGSLDVGYCHDKSYYNPDTYAHYVYEITDDNHLDHEVSIVGWDDTFPKEKFLIPPDGDGAWIVKNSWGPEWGEDGYFYISYYDKSLMNDRGCIDEIEASAAVIIIENTEPYNKNYQYDLGLSYFLPGEGNASYYNVFKSLDDDLIAAVGTYFNQSGVGYTVEIFVNDELRLTQTGVSPYLGYHTIKLNDYIPIKKGDIFKAKITSNAIPIVDEKSTNVRYIGNISFISTDGLNWEDGHEQDNIACLKVYTVDDDSKIIGNENITVDYGSESYFSVQVVTADGHTVGAGATVNFTINGKTTTVLTDEDGVAKIKITETPDTYTMTTTINGKDYTNTVTVKLAPTPAGTFNELDDAIKNSTKNYLNLYSDYEFNNETDNKLGILIDRDNFIINGNGRTIDGKNQSRIFNITANNITLSNLILTGGNAEKGGAIYTTGLLTLNNVTFINNYAKIEGGAVGLYSNVILTCNNSDFIDNYAEAGSAIFVQKGVLNLYNADLSSKIFNMYSQIAALTNSAVYIENATFSNSSSSYSPALYLRSSKTSVINSKFINLRGNITSGAIGVRMGGDLYVKNCEFINTTSSKNAGAIFADVLYDDYLGVVTIIDTVFKDTGSEFGGAFLQLSGNLFLNNTKFINGHATYNGGSVYLSCVNGIINNCTFDSNGVDFIEDYPTYGGAILLDMGTYNISGSKFFNNNASAGAAIYAYDSAYTITNSIFENNTNPIYTFFDKQSIIDETNTFINDNNISTNNTFFATIIIGEGMQITLTNNTINVTTLPARYDSRDWGWTSSVKAQGWMGSCWTFGMTGAMESALLKATGITTDFSENNMQNTMIKYSIYGSPKIYEGGGNTYAASYLLSWLGAFTQDADTYDEMGKISPLITSNQDIHVQDLMFIPNNEIPNGTQLKEAILKYGSVEVCYYGQSRYDEVSLYYNTETYAQYVDEFVAPNHDVSIVGWDDNFPKEKFLTPPPGNGAWIVKNSWGPGWGDNGYLYVSYYDQSLLPYLSGSVGTSATAIIFENTIPYTKNYQYDIVWTGSFVPSNGNISYMNIFEALDDDLIAAVGTYFNRSDVNYKVEIYVNDELRLTQEGVSPFTGYHTIKLDEYIPIKKGDVFKAVMTSDAMPGVEFTETRLHYSENISFYSYDGENWIDCYTEEAVASLKVYTVADDSKIINNENITVDYGSGSYFTVQVVTADDHAVGAGAVVNFTINGKTTTAITDADGMAKVKITNVPGTYEMTTSYNGQTYKNSVVVKLDSSTCKITQNKNIKVDYDGGKYFSVKIVSADGKVAASGVSVKFKINGKTTTVKTDKNGIAKIKITDVPKKYTMTTTYNGKSVKNTVTVKQVLKAKKVTVKKTAKKFTLKATLKINGKLVKGKQVTFKFNGKTYKVKTNKKGVAQKTLKKSVIKKLKKGKKYTVKVTYKKDTIKTTVKVK